MHFDLERPIVMKKTGTNIDGNPREQAHRLRAMSTGDRTTDENVQEAIHSEARRREVEALVKMDGLDLGNAETMRNAWRTCNTDPCDTSSDTDQGVEPPSPEGSP